MCEFDFRNEISIQYFLGGQTNITYNALDRHLEKRGDQIAILWEGNEPSEDAKLTYRELHAEVCKFANVLKCRPPGNRDPRPGEIDSCKGYLREQIRLIAPEVVVTLGNFATKLLLRTETGITRLRGQRFDWWLGAVLVPTFHPAAALRGGERVRAQMRDDFEIVSQILAEAPSEPAASETPQEQMDLFG